MAVERDFDLLQLNSSSVTLLQSLIKLILLRKMRTRFQILGLFLFCVLTIGKYRATSSNIHHVHNFLHASSTCTYQMFFDDSSKKSDYISWLGVSIHSAKPIVITDTHLVSDLNNVRLPNAVLLIVGFPVKYGETCIIQIFFVNSYTSKSPIISADPPQLSLENVKNLIKPIKVLYGTPEYTIIVSQLDKLETIKYTETFAASQALRKIENILEQLSSKILFSEMSTGKLHVLCIPCALKEYGSPFRQSENLNYKDKVQLQDHWTRLNSNFQNIKVDPELSSRLKLCHTLILNMNIPFKDADQWDYNCMRLLLRDRYNHTLSFEPFLGSVYSYFENIPAENLTRSLPTHHNLRAISSSGSMAKGFVYRIINRARDQPGLSLKTFIDVGDFTTWFTYVLLIILLVIVLHFGGVTSITFWIISEALENGPILRNMKPGIMFTVFAWSFGTFIFRQLYSSEMYGNLTQLPLPTLPGTLDELAFKSEIPLLTHMYDFLMGNFTTGENLQPDSERYLMRYRQQLHVVNDLLNQIWPILRNLDLKDVRAKGTTVIPSYQTPVNFATLLYFDDMMAFEVLLTALDHIHEYGWKFNAHIVRNNQEIIFPRLRSWTMANTFVAPLALRYIANIYEAGIYERLLIVKISNRIIARYEKNLIDTGVGHKHKHIRKPRWVCLALSDRIRQERNAGKNKVYAISVESLETIWIVYGTCTFFSLGSLCIELIAWMVLSKISPIS